MFIFVLPAARGKAIARQAWTAALSDVPSGSLAGDMSSCKEKRGPVTAAKGRRDGRGDTLLETLSP